MCLYYNELVNGYAEFCCRLRGEFLRFDETDHELMRSWECLH
jgi:hypothetical protein